MFEDMTYEALLSRMLTRASEEAQSNGELIDTREGSLIRTALSPAAVELTQAYIAGDDILDETFADTATRSFLIRRCAERGITPYPATYAIRKGMFNIDVPVGARFSLNTLNYVAIEKIGEESGGTIRTWKLRCETLGAIGNAESGALIPVNYISGLTYAFLADVLIPGEDEENTELLRQRYLDSLNTTAFGGNIQDYVNKTKAIEGVGAVKVYPVWNGGGTVKLVILDAQFNPPSQILIDAVQTDIDPVQNQGVGLGIAPIGHVVTVEGATATTVDVSAEIAIQSGTDWAAVLPTIQNVVDSYFAELAAGWDAVDWRADQTATLIVRRSQIETRVLGVAGVIDIQNTIINGTAQNLVLGANSVPTRGEITNASV